MARPAQARPLVIGLVVGALLLGCSSDGLDPSTSIDDNGGSEPPATDTRVSQESLPSLPTEP